MKKTVATLLAMTLVLSFCGCGLRRAPGVTAEPAASATDIREQTGETEPLPPTEPDPQTLPPTAPEDTTLPPTGPDTAVILQPEPADSDFVPVADYFPDLSVELRYAGEDNFTGQQIYPFREAYLRYGTVKKLILAQEILSTQGLGLKLWDGFRPVTAQFLLWEACPDPRYVADPRYGYSSHSRGNTVDITLTDASGLELTMPTGFDVFSSLADRDYSDCPEEAARNARLLQEAMEEAGFQGYFGEWWHFTDTDAYPVEEVFEPVEEHLRLAVCDEHIPLYSRPDPSSEVLCTVPRDHVFTVLAGCEPFLLVRYEGLRGYVPERDTQKLE